jgi:hypothetical protein
MQDLTPTTLKIIESGALRILRVRDAVGRRIMFTAEDIGPAFDEIHRVSISNIVADTEYENFGY